MNSNDKPKVENEYLKLLKAFGMSYSDTPLTWKNCDTLMIVTEPGFLSGNKGEWKTWKAFQMFHQTAPEGTRTETALIAGTKYFIPYSEYVKGEIDPDYFPYKGFVYFSSIKSNDQERIWLKEKADQGFMIFTQNMACFPGSKGYEFYENNNFYLGFTNMTMDIVNINPEDYPVLLKTRNTCMKLEMFGNVGLNRGRYISDFLDTIVVTANPVTMFYHILKICEYCIHMQALKSLCTDSTLDEKAYRALISPSLGTLSRLQINDDELAVPELAESARQLDMFLSGKTNSPLKKTRVSYHQLCELVIRIRNRYLGHGTVTESEVMKFLAPFSEIMQMIVLLFVDSPRIEETDYLCIPVNGFNVPAMKLHMKQEYFFCGFYNDSKEMYADYLCFHTGYVIRYKLSSFNKPVLIDEPTAEDTDSKFIPAAYKDDQWGFDKKETKTIRHYFKVISNHDLILDLYRDIGLSLYDNPHLIRLLPTARINSIYEILNSEKMPSLMAHRLFLDGSHPTVILLMKYDLYERIFDKKTSITDNLFYYFMELGLFLPQAKCVAAVIGTKAKKAPDSYPWIRNLHIRSFKTDMEYLHWISLFSNNMIIARRMEKAARWNRKIPTVKKIGKGYDFDGHYREHGALYSRLLKQYECDSIFRNYNNFYFAGMLKNAFDLPNLEFSFTGLFDYLEFALLSVYYDLKSRYEPKSDEIIGNVTNIYLLGLAIADLCTEYNDPRLELIHDFRIPVCEELQKLHLKCTELIPIKLDGTELSFRRTCQVLRYLRNRTKGHGFIRSEAAESLWEMTMHYTMALDRFLTLSFFDMSIQSGQLQTQPCKCAPVNHQSGKFWILDQNMPCPLVEIKNDMKTYLNYFTGSKFKVKTQSGKLIKN